ncbi:MarR family winged helix-turn-helix transcriptional regulator [Tundrisphaera lichenicola]|uniref:MarR family winged helix-turn-helix transcriptional regulator n=1 Tax=Tundrisphaera lichenicola TaxID=2029860 RepID=UPI003EBD5883
MSASGEDGSEASAILGGIWEVIESVMNDSAPALEALGLSPKAYFLLDVVGDHPFPAELARRTHLPPPTVTYLIKQLEAKDFLERRAEPGDLRKFRLVVTAPGEEALRRGREALGIAMGGRLRRLGPDEICALGRIVRRLAGRGDEGDPK